MKEYDLKKAYHTVKAGQFIRGNEEQFPMVQKYGLTGIGAPQFKYGSFVILTRKGMWPVSYGDWIIEDPMPATIDGSMVTQYHIIPAQAFEVFFGKNQTMEEIFKELKTDKAPILSAIEKHFEQNDSYYGHKSHCNLLFPASNGNCDCGATSK